MTDHRLHSLIQRSRELLEDLDSSRQDLLSVADMNRVLRQVLRNQVEIMQRIGPRAIDDDAPTTVQPRPEPLVVPTPANGSTPKISIRQRDESGNPVEPAPVAHRPPAPTPDEPDDPRHRDLSSVDPLDGKELKQLKQALGGDPVEHDIPEGLSLAEAILQESRTVQEGLAREFVQEFDNRDKDYEKGLIKLNRWVGGGAAGTPFQWRGNKAYLNLNGMGADALRKYEQQLMTRMGFSRRVGRLTLPDLEGEVVVYERP